MKKIFILGSPATYENYEAAVSGCGAYPVFSDTPDGSHNCDALLLTGGADLNPSLYGQENLGSEGIDDLRDAAEFQLIRSFSQSGRPILGICRGFQAITVYFGGSLIQDLPPAQKLCHSRMGSDQDKVHPVTVPADSFLAKLYGERFCVNSAHHQAADRIPQNFRLFAKSADGVTEAIGDASKRIYGVQWHPERMAFRHKRPDTVDGRLLLDFFLRQV